MHDLLLLAQDDLAGRALVELNLPLLLMQLCITLWVFVLGACFGSFLNVVIYRLPVGMSLGRPKSHCPRCETPLAARDNLPVLGWILLHGRCRYCELPISVRYPLIESICGAVFLLLLFTELLTGAANLPLRHPDHFAVRSGFWLVYFAKWDLLGIYLLHCLLLVSTLAIVMIGFDGHRVPRRLVTFVASTGLAVGTVWPELRPVQALPYPAFLYDWKAQAVWTDSWLSPGSVYETGVTAVGFLDGLAGIAVGGFLAAVVRWSAQRLSLATGRPSLVAAGWSFVGVGSVLGWQGCGMLAVLAFPGMTVLAAMHRWKSAPLSDVPAVFAGPALFVLLCGFLPGWQWLHSATWMIGIDGWKWTATGPWMDWGGCLIALLVLSAINRLVFPESPLESPSTSGGV